ncbi:MAG TPA: hypothetical protein VHL98_04290 [Microvirga sp.]|jgi:hypothetical protein|nr:hypothetical protein [Microvirga sp.]
MAAKVLCSYENGDCGCPPGLCAGEPEATIRGEVYLAAEKVMEAINDTALVLTGRRDHFWLKGH